MKVADTWRLATIAFGVVTLLLAVGAVILAAETKGSSLVTHLGAFLVAITAGGLTAYCARQSGHHRDREQNSKRLEMELSAFGPFTNALAEPDEARKAYADRLFRGAEQSEEGQTTISKDQVNLLQTLVEALMKVRN
jgi:hypothetical protein